MFCRRSTICITNSMEQSSSSEVNGLSAGQDIHHLLQNLKVYYHVHNSPSPAPILSKMNPIHTLILRFFNIQSMPRVHSGLFLTFRLTKIFGTFYWRKRACQFLQSISHFPTVELRRLGLAMLYIVTLYQHRNYRLLKRTSSFKAYSCLLH
jgi:hypothetical protein